jgi:hypothetical protein
MVGRNFQVPSLNLKFLLCGVSHVMESQSRNLKPRGCRFLLCVYIYMLYLIETTNPSTHGIECAQSIQRFANKYSSISLVCLPICLLRLNKENPT